MSEPDKQSNYYIKILREERDGKRGKAKYKCWIEEVDGKFVAREKLLSFDSEFPIK